MSVVSLLSFGLAMFVLAVSPGPGVFATIARALASGFASTLIFIAGIVLGDIIFLLAAIYGLSTIAMYMGEVFIAVKYLGGAYLIYLGYTILKSHAKAANIHALREPSKKANFLSGLSITLGNPKVILFYLGFLPTFMDLKALTFSDVMMVGSVVVGVLFSVMAVYAYVASRAKHLFQSPQAIRKLDIGAGSVMMGAGAYLIAKP
ncbi:MAG: LysE family translocator [Sulfurospirillaceae bacterium]|jgi:threonine/homoserine/homoserine lactone efflux protein|nr:LysE family translocator [Sulfurospirillaceae bacterium]MDD2827696.1 LysE family translocator [Sulfurospirillaceae bacterium]